MKFVFEIECVYGRKNETYRVKVDFNVKHQQVPVEMLIGPVWMPFPFGFLIGNE